LDYNIVKNDKGAIVGTVTSNGFNVTLNGATGGTATMQVRSDITVPPNRTVPAMGAVL